jgi:hypothetical protein
MHRGRRPAGHRPDDPVLGAPARVRGASAWPLLVAGEGSGLEPDWNRRRGWRAGGIAGLSSLLGAPGAQRGPRRGGGGASVALAPRPAPDRSGRGAHLRALIRGGVRGAPGGDQSRMDDRRAAGQPRARTGFRPPRHGRGTWSPPVRRAGMSLPWDLLQPLRGRRAQDRPAGWRRCQRQVNFP